MTKEKQKELITFLAYMEAKIDANQELEKWGNMRLVHFGLKEICYRLNINVRSSDHFELTKKYKKQILKNNDFKPKEIDTCFI